MKIRPVRALFFHADGLTDGRREMTKLIVAFCNFANASMTSSNITIIRTFFKGRTFPLLLNANQ